MAKCRGVRPPVGTCPAGASAPEGVDLEDRDAVVPAVRPVEEATVRRDRDLGCLVPAREPGRQCRDRLERLEGAAPRVVAEGRHRGAKLADRVKAIARRVPGEVARARALFERHGFRVTWLEGAGRGIEPIDEDPVRAQVGGEGEALRAVEDYRVGVRPLLARPVRSAPHLSANRGGRLQATVRADGKDGHAPTGVVGHEDVPAAPVHGDVAWVGPARGLLAEPGEAFPSHRRSRRRSRHPSPSRRTSRAR